MLMWISGLVLLLIMTKLVFGFIYRFKLKNLHDKHVIVTGCDSGFGRMLALQLDASGMVVIATTLTEAGVKELREKGSSRMICRQMDVTDPDSVQNLVDYVTQILPAGQGLWGLVNNSGVIGVSGPMCWLRVSDFESCIRVNLLGMIDVTLKCLPLIMLAKGRIVNMSSVAGRITFAGSYSVSKFAVEGFSDTLRVDMKTWDVSVSTIEPGFFFTGIVNQTIMKNMFKKNWERLDSRIQALYGRPFFEHCMNKVEKQTYWGSSDLTQVTDAMEHALTARYPHTRYVVGRDARWIWIPISYLPSCLADPLMHQLVRKHYTRPNNPNMAALG